MFTFILIVDKRVRPENAGNFLTGLGIVRQESNGRYIVEGSRGMEDGWMAISSSDAVANDYSVEDLDMFKIKIDEPSFFVVEGRDNTTNFANSFVLNLDNSLNALIDNDHGRIDSVKAFKGLIAAHADWLHASC